MFRQCFVTCFIAALLLFEITDSQEIQGRVNLGSDGNSTTSSDFVFTLNVNSGTLPLNFDLYNVTDGSNATGDAFDEDVTVSCAITTVFTAGDSVLSFADTVIQLRNGVTGGDVSFDIISQGRRVEVQCRGETTTPGLTSYFSLNTSAGQTGHVTIKKSPILRLCQERIFVANSNGITRGQVNLQLSEPVQGSNVTAQCDVTGITAVGMVVWLEFDTVRIIIDQDSATMAYDISGRGDTLQVTCYAESDDDVQYQRNSSSSEVLFDLEMGSVKMLPATSKVTSNKYTPLLVLSEPLQPGDDEVTFLCILTKLNSTDEMQKVIDSTECTVPESGVATTPNPTVGPTPAMATSPNGTTSNSTVPETTPMNTTQLPITTLSLTTPQITTPQLTTPLLTTFAPTTPLPLTQSSMSPIPTTPTANSSSEWRLAESEIVFQEGDMERALLISRSDNRDGYQGVLLVTCCAAVELNSPKYSGLITAAVAMVDVPPARSINWTEASDISQLETERIITNPAYTEVSPCPCDLTANKCDVNCCCDTLCSEEEQTAFTCIPGIPGGNFTVQDDYNCKNPNIFRSDWSPFLCVETDNSPYLGYYFSSQSGARATATFNTLKARATTPQSTSFEDTEQRSLEFQDEDANAGGYKFGFPVETLFKTSVRGFLALPQVDSNGGCSWLSPIRFQMGMSSSCDVDPKQDLCVESSVLSARAFTLSSNAAYPPCSEAPGILRSYGGINPAPTSVRYYCTDDITAYLISGKRIGELFSPNQESLFPDGSSNATLTLPDRCSWDDGFTLPPVPQYNNQTSLCSNVVLDVRYELFWQGNQVVQADAIVVLGAAGLSPGGTQDSSDGDGDITFVTPPTTPVPTMEVTVEGTEIVTIIEDVTDIITMLGTDVTTFGTSLDPTTQMETTIAPTTQPQTAAPPATSPQPLTTPAPQVTTMDFTTSSMTTGSSIVVEPYPALPFTQRFLVKFTHLSTPISDPSPLDPPDVSNQVERSGKPGYVVGRRVLSGVAIYDPQIECNNESVCTTAEPVQFSDFVRIDDAETNRLRVWAPGPGSLCSQSSLVDVTFGEDHVSGCILRLGWSQVRNCSTLRETMLMEFQSMVAADRIGKIGNASTTILTNWAPIFNSEEHPFPTDPPPATVAMTTDSMTTDSMTTSEELSEPEVTPLDLSQGACYGIPTGVNLEILYADTGEFGGIVQQEILSANINFRKSIIKFQCSGANSVTCHLNQSSDNTTEWVQSFPITSSVVFTKVPADIGFTGGIDSTRCDYDQCFEAMYFPFSPLFQGDSPQYTIGVALFLVLLTIGYVAFTRLRSLSLLTQFI